MKIKKIAQSIGVVGKILNTKSTSQNDTYSCDYINGLHTYSNEEQVIGKWIDGKPVYRKVVSYTQPDKIGVLNALTTVNIPHNTDNFERTVKVSGFSSTGNILPIINGSNTTTITANVAFVDATNIQFRLINVELSVRTWYFILEYTKTTD